MLVELNRTKQANYQNQIKANFEQIPIIFHSESCSCNNWKLMTPDPAPGKHGGETLKLLLDSKTFRSLRDLPMYICKSLCRDLFNVDVIVCDCLTSWAFRCMKINWSLLLLTGVDSGTPVCVHLCFESRNIICKVRKSVLFRLSKPMDYDTFLLSRAMIQD